MCACEQVHNVTTLTPYARRSELVTEVTLSWKSSWLDRPVQRNDAAGQVQPVDLAPAGLDHPQGEAALIGPAADRLGEVDVRLRVRRHPLGDARQGLHQVVRVHRLERSPGGGTELAHHDAPAAAGDTQHLPEALHGVVDVAQPEGDGDGV